MSQHNITDGDYVLTDGAAWFTVEGMSIRIYSTHKEVRVNVYREGQEMEQSIASIYVPIKESNNVAA